MTKILTRKVEIEECGDCDHHTVCTCDITPDVTMGTRWKDIPDCPEIPSWCPLPNKQKKGEAL